MGKLIKCHFYYLMNKTTICLLGISIIGLVLFAMINVLSFDERMALSDERLYYYESLYEASKILGSFIAVMLFGYYFSYTCDSYRTIIINKKVTRTKYYISKVLLILSVFTFYYLWMMTVIIVIALLKEIMMDVVMLQSFIYLFITLLFYGLLSILFIIVLDNIYVVFIIVPLSLINYDKNLYFLCYIMPLTKNQPSIHSFILPWWYYLFLIMAFFAVTIILYKIKDLPN